MKTHTRIVLFVLLALSVLPLVAQGRGTSLGIMLGAALPGAATPSIPSNQQPSFNWGFFVNMPLLQTFHIAPSAELYKFGSNNATDFDLAFKFIVPLQRFSAFAGISPGVTTVNSLTAPHIGLVGGGAFNFVSNLDGFVQAKYSLVFDGNNNTNVLHFNTGVLFNF